MKHFRQILGCGALACVCVATLAPGIAAAATKRSCHWDRTTGRMICQRVPVPPGDGTPTPPPPPPSK